jgi:hypothetical protein
MSDLFLKPPEVDELTGIKKHPQKIEVQSQWLKSHRIRHWLNAAQRIIIPRAEIEYGKPAPESETWSPKV